MEFFSFNVIFSHDIYSPCVKHPPSRNGDKSLWRRCEASRVAMVRKNKTKNTSNILTRKERKKERKKERESSYPLGCICQSLYSCTYWVTRRVFCWKTLKSFLLLRVVHSKQMNSERPNYTPLLLSVLGICQSIMGRDYFEEEEESNMELYR